MLSCHETDTPRLVPQTSQNFAVQPVQPTQPSNEVTEASQPVTRILQLTTFEREVEHLAREDLNSYDAVYEVRDCKILLKVLFEHQIFIPKKPT